MVKGGQAGRPRWRENQWLGVTSITLTRRYRRPCPTQGPICGVNRLVWLLSGSPLALAVHFSGPGSILITLLAESIHEATFRTSSVFDDHEQWSKHWAAAALPAFVKRTFPQVPAWVLLRGQKACWILMAYCTETQHFNSIHIHNKHFCCWTQTHYRYIMDCNLRI